MTWNKGRILMCLSLRIKILCSRCETGVTSYKSKDIYRSGFRQVLSADCFYMVMRKAQWINFHVCLNFVMVLPLGASSFFE